MHYKRLTIVSDTALYQKDGSYYGFGPVVRELEEIEYYFDEIIWIGYNRPDKITDRSLCVIKSNKIKVILLNANGGKTIFDKLKIILHYPLMTFVIFKCALHADIIHSRGPSHPAFISILISYLFPKKIWWHKFAGSWDESTLPRFYKTQKRLLEKAKHIKVTINGFWNNQPSHCYSFENPCLTQEDIKKGKEIAQTKTFDQSYIFSFVGRLEDAKGVSRIIEALKEIPAEKIKEVHFVGNGNKTEQYIKQASFLGNKVFFHGFLGKNGVHTILSKSHFFLLPSDSEGFPKVIAEAACYGAIPVVSDVGSISHYVSEKNGFVWSNKNATPYTEILKKAVNEQNITLKQLSENSCILAKLFTFDNYKQKLESLVFRK